MNLQPPSLFALLFFVTTFSFSQTATDTITAYQYYQKADSLLEAKETKASNEFFNKALIIYKKAKNWKKVVSCYNKISENYYGQGKYKKSIENLKKLLEFKTKKLGDNHLDIAETHHRLGIVYGIMDKLDLALSHHVKSISIRKKHLGKNHPDLATPYNQLGIIYGSRGQYDVCIEYFKKAQFLDKKSENNKTSFTPTAANLNISKAYLEIGIPEKALHYIQKAKEYYVNNNLPLDYVYSMMGDIYGSLGLYDLAIEYINKSLMLRLKEYSKDHPVLNYNYESMGLFYKESGQIEKALEYFSLSTEILIKTYGKDHIEYLNNLMHIGSIYRMKKEYDKALFYFNKVLNTKKSKTNYKNFISSLYQNLSLTYAEISEYDKSELYLGKSMEVLSDNLENYLHKTVACYNSFTEFYYKQQQQKKALTYADKALLSNYKQKNATISEIEYSVNAFYNFNQLLATLQYKGKALQELYKENKDLQYLHQSIDLYQKIESLIEEIQKLRQNYQDKISFAKDVKSIYLDAIRAQLCLYKNTKQPQDLQKAFYYIEKSRSNTLKGLLAENHAKNFSKIPDSLLTLEQEVKAYHSFYLSQITKEQFKKEIDSVTLASYQSKLFDINRKQDSITQLLEKNYPKYYQLKYQNQIVSIPDIQQQLGKNTTLLEFITNDSITYAFTVSKDSLSVKKLAISGLADKIEQLQKAITSEDHPNYEKLAYQLYQDLISPIREQLKGEQIIIVPDGPLWYLNFDLLLTQKENTVRNDEELSYLLRKFAISYANSATVLFNSQDDTVNTSKIQNECLAFSFSDSTKITESQTISLANLRDTEKDLPGTRKEIKAISNIIDGQYYFGDRANESNFKKNVGNYTILHLALHGEMDDKNPDNSKLHFTKVKDSIEDNLLYSHELFALNIPAELTVLSACNTGSGKIAEGEGIMSLGNAFQYAGTKSLLLSRWKVSDKTTPQLMQYFYTNLKSGMNKAKALQQAKLQYLNTSDALYTHPFYWSSFYLIGNTNPMRFQESGHMMYWGIAIAMFLILWIFIISKKIKYYK